MHQLLYLMLICLPLTVHARSSLAGSACRLRLKALQALWSVQYLSRAGAALTHVDRPDSVHYAAVGAPDRVAQPESDGGDPHAHRRQERTWHKSHVLFCTNRELAAVVVAKEEYRRSTEASNVASAG